MFNKSCALARDDTYGHDERSENHPAGLPPQTGPVSDHFLNVVIELVGTCKRKKMMRMKHDTIKRTTLTDFQKSCKQATES